MASNPEYHVDVVADRVFRSLLRDFRAVHGQQFARKAEESLNSGIAEFRSYEWPIIGDVDPHRFKCWYQLRSLFKRHIFSDDVYDQRQLEERTMNSYLESQLYFGLHRDRTPRTHAVLQEARRIAKSILQQCDYNEAASYVKIGRRATLGGPLLTAFLDEKVGNPRAFTCPSAVRKWFFKDYLSTDPVLARLVRKVFRKSKREVIPLDLAADYLNLVNVPKSWKILRGITPLALIGLFLSYAIGGLVTERLRTNARLDIRRLQARHRRLARKYSKTNTHATVDMKTASNSVMSQHLNAVLPRQWYRFVRKTFVRQIALKSDKERLHYTCSILPMGNGCTFPIETLFFYCLIKAVGNLLGAKGTYSVYGDDLIYPSRIHSYVLRVFEELGLRINKEKSFVDSAFRESCGGDYFRGIDVRPAMLPEVERHTLRRREYASYLYKVANALRARWEDEEIPCTLHWLKTELAVTQGVIYQVPMHFPSTAGWKVKRPELRTWWEPWYVPKVSFVRGDIIVRFKFLGLTTPKLRSVVDEEVYYWDSLRSMSLRKPPGWRFWDNWLVEVPTSSVEIGSHTYFKLVKYKSKTGSCIVPKEPARERAGITVVDETVSLDYWTCIQP